MPRKTLVHIGYQKTASTWLQTQFFNHSELRFAMPLSSSTIKEKLVLPHSFMFKDEMTRNDFKSSLIQVPDDETPVVSVESLSGSFFSNGSDGIERANRIKSVFPNAAILINIREQRSMLRSSYKHYVKALGTLSAQQWLSASELDIKQKLPIFDPIRYQYHHLISHYQSLFGVDNVLILPCEQLWKSPKSYVGRIAEFAQVELPNNVRENLNYDYKSNKGLSAFAANAKRRINRLLMHDIVLNPKPFLRSNMHNNTLKKLAYRVDRRIPSSIKLRSEQKLIDTIDQWAGEKFQQSNQITMELTGLNLELYGYDLPRSASK